jgi:hypothetical protein
MEQLVMGGGDKAGGGLTKLVDGFVDRARVADQMGEGMVCAQPSLGDLTSFLCAPRAAVHLVSDFSCKTSRGAPNLLHRPRQGGRPDGPKRRDDGRDDGCR